MILKGTALLMLGLTLTSMGNNTVDDDFRDEFLERINAVRRTGCNCGTQRMAPAPPLVWNDQLEDAAKDHAKDMARKKYFSHESRNGRTIKDRIMGAGYTYKGFRSYAIAENIAYGQRSIAEVQNGWFKSPGHCKNLMNPDLKEVGVAEKDNYWVQDFGGRENFTPQQQQMIEQGARIIQKRG